MQDLMMMSGNEKIAAESIDMDFLRHGDFFDHDGLLFDTVDPLPPPLLDEVDIIDLTTPPDASFVPTTPLVATCEPSTVTTVPAGTTSTTAPTPVHQLDEADRMLCHEDFPALVKLAVRVKSLRVVLASHGGFLQHHDASQHSPSQMEPDQVVAAVSRMQEQCVSKNKTRGTPLLKKGIYPLTDSMLDESFEILQHELERGEKLLSKTPPKPPAPVKPSGLPPSNKRRKTKPGEAIAVKYSKWQTDILMEWMIAHKEHPFPDAQQIQELCRITGLSHSQVVNWTTNVRKRNMKATVDNGKKPHHFLDFLFLAADRDKRHANMLPGSVPMTPIAHYPTAMGGPPFANTDSFGSYCPTVSPMSLPPGYNPYQSYPPPRSPVVTRHHDAYEPFSTPPVSRPVVVPGSVVASNRRRAASSHAPREEEWDMKLRVVSESFEEGEIPEPDLLNQLEEEYEPDCLLSKYALRWHDSTGEDETDTSIDVTPIEESTTEYEQDRLLSIWALQLQGDSDVDVTGTTSTTTRIDASTAEGSTAATSADDDCSSMKGQILEDMSHHQKQHGESSNKRKRKESFTLDWENDDDDDFNLDHIDALEDRMNQLLEEAMDM